ncbi:MAG: hypothetical protein AB1714_28080 [Acidobacteriota bacterium]
MFRKRWLAAAAGLVILLSIPLARILRYTPDVRPGDGQAGVMHVHSVESDGGGDFDEIARKAAEAGLDFVVVTDHGNPSRPTRKPPAKPVLIIGSELSTDAGHLLALAYGNPTYNFPPDPAEAAADVESLGGFVVLSHPFNDRIPWRQWPFPLSTGMEVLNGDSEWREVGWWKLAVTLPSYWLNPAYFHLRLMHYPRQALEAFDREAADRVFYLFAGLDAHANLRVGRKRSLRFPDYLPLFRTLVLRMRPDVSGDKDAIMDALRHGRFYVSIDGLASGAGFRFDAQSGTGRYGMGDVVPDPPVELEASADEGSMLRIRRNGAVVAAGITQLRYQAADPGAYRVEVRRPLGSHPFDPEIPWILSNPIFVGSKYAQQRPPRPAAAPPPAGVAFETSRFNVERDSSSACEYDGSRLHFRLGSGASAQSWPVVALCWRTPPPLEPGDRFLVRLRSDRTYRLWFQAHVGTKIYRTSLKASSISDTRVVDLDRLSPTPEAAGTAFDPHRVTGIFFVLDRQCVPLGTEGDIWMESFALAERQGPAVAR